MVVSLGSYYFDARFAKPPYREAAQHVFQMAQPDEAVVHTGNGSFVPFLFYVPPPNHFLLEGDPKPHQPGSLFSQLGGQSIAPEALTQFETFWLVVALDHSIDYQRQVVTQFDDRYALLDATEIGGILIRRYSSGKDR